MLVACRPLRVMFVHTFMPVGGAETLLVNLIRRLDRDRFIPEVCCLKFPGPLGEVIGEEVALFSHLLRGKYDLRVLPKLTSLLKRRKIDAVVTVGAGDRMFWGRLAAKAAGVPVILTALHSTGWPDVVGRLNRLLTPITDGFIGVAQEHGRYLREVERFPANKVFVIPNGVDVTRFQPRAADPKLRAEFGLGSAPVVGIVAALRPEKNHQQFLRAAAKVRAILPAARFLIVGDGDPAGCDPSGQHQQQKKTWCRPVRRRVMAWHRSSAPADCGERRGIRRNAASGTQEGRVSHHVKRSGALATIAGLPIDRIRTILQQAKVASLA